MAAECADGLFHGFGDYLRGIFEGSTAVSTENHNIIIVCRRNAQNAAHSLYVELIQILIANCNTHPSILVNS